MGILRPAGEFDTTYAYDMSTIRRRNVKKPICLVSFARRIVRGLSRDARPKWPLSDLPQELEPVMEFLACLLQAKCRLDLNSRSHHKFLFNAAY